MCEEFEILKSYRIVSKVDEKVKERAPSINFDVRMSAKSILRYGAVLSFKGYSYPNNT